MDVDRRKFLKVAGLSVVVGLTGQKSIEAFAEQILPEELPLTATRWAMAIDLRKCLKEEGCTSCIDACHYAHNVPHFSNPKDEVKWIWKEPFEQVFEDQEHKYIDEQLQQSLVLVFCNHCDKPPCVKVCPTKATWKREEDGIVMMDMHRCIGCRYCVAACPYGSRSFNWRDPRPFIKEMNPEFPTRSKGVVEKCNFCVERLARGIPPACADACKFRALTFGDLGDPRSEIRKILSSRYAIRRRPYLGTEPQIYYLV